MYFTPIRRKLLFITLTNIKIFKAFLINLPHSMWNVTTTCKETEVYSISISETLKNLQITFASSSMLFGCRRWPFLPLMVTLLYLTQRKVSLFQIPLKIFIIMKVKNNNSDLSKTSFIFWQNIWISTLVSYTKTVCCTLLYQPESFCLGFLIPYSFCIINWLFKTSQHSWKFLWPVCLSAVSSCYESRKHTPICM